MSVQFVIEGLKWEPFSVKRGLNSLPNDNILDWPKLKAFADDNSNVAAKMMISFYDRVENIVRKGENAGYQHFLLFSQCFQKAFSTSSLKAGIVWQNVNALAKSIDPCQPAHTAPADTS